MKVMLKKTLPPFGDRALLDASESLEREYRATFFSIFLARHCIARWLTWVKRREEWKEFSQLETEKLVEPLSARAKVISQSHSSKVGLSGSSRIVDVLRNLVKKSGRRRSCQSKFLGPNKSPKSRCRFNWSDWLQGSLLEQQIPLRLSHLILS